MSDKHLFQSGTLNRLALKNRIMVAPMTRISASVDGIPGERMQHYYQRFVRGGFSAIITEGIYIDEAWSQTYAFQAGLVNAKQSAGWRAITERVHQRGGKIIAQLMHAGRYRRATFIEQTRSRLLRHSLAENSSVSITVMAPIRCRVK